MDTPDITSLLYMDEPTAQEKARVMAAALRGQQAQAQQRQLFGALGGMTGSEGIAGLGQAYGAGGAQDYKQAGQDLEALQGLPQARLQRQQAQEQFAKAQRENTEAERRRAALASGETPESVSQIGLAQAFGVPGLKPGMPGNVVSDEMMQLGEKLQANKESLTLRESLAKQQSQARMTESEWKHAMAEQAAADRKSKVDEKAAQDLDKGLRTLREDIDPTLGRGKGSFGKDADLRVAAQKVLALVRPPGSAAPNYNLTVTQVPEFVQSVASMLSSGGQAHEAQLERLLPHTAGMSLAQKLEWVAGHPEDANVAAFIKQYADTADREDKLAAARIRAGQLKRLVFHRGGLKSNKDEYLSAAHEYLNDLTPAQLESAFNGTYREGAAGAGEVRQGKNGKHYRKGADGTWEEVD